MSVSRLSLLWQVVEKMEPTIGLEPMACRLRIVACFQPLRSITQLFVNRVLLLESAVTLISEGRFDGQAILFSDSGQKLRQQVEMADEALTIF